MNQVALTECKGEPSAPAFVEDYPASKYHAHHSISKSGLDLVHKSPAHYAQRVERAPTQAMKTGTAIHTAILEPDRFAAAYHVADAKDRRAKAWKEAVEKYGDEYVLLPSEHESIVAVQNAALSRPEVKRLAHAPGWPELSAFATDPVTGVLVRCRYDLLAKAAFAVDLKTARDVFERGFARSCATYRYHVQVALYSDIYEWITGEKLNEF